MFQSDYRRVFAKLQSRELLMFASEESARKNLHVSDCCELDLWGRKTEARTPCVPQRRNQERNWGVSALPCKLSHLENLTRDPSV